MRYSSCIIHFTDPLNSITDINVTGYHVLDIGIYLVSVRNYAHKLTSPHPNSWQFVLQNYNITNYKYIFTRNQSNVCITSLYRYSLLLFFTEFRLNRNSISRLISLLKWMLSRFFRNNSVVFLFFFLYLATILTRDCGILFLIPRGKYRTVLEIFHMYSLTVILKLLNIVNHTKRERYEEWMFEWIYFAHIIKSK